MVSANQGFWKKVWSKHVKIMKNSVNIFMSPVEKLIGNFSRLLSLVVTIFIFLFGRAKYYEKRTEFKMSQTFEWYLNNRRIVSNASEIILPALVSLFNWQNLQLSLFHPVKFILMLFLFTFEILIHSLITVNFILYVNWDGIDDRWTATNKRKEIMI